MDIVRNAMDTATNNVAQMPIWEQGQGPQRNPVQQNPIYNVYDGRFQELLNQYSDLKQQQQQHRNDPMMRAWIQTRLDTISATLNAPAGNVTDHGNESMTTGGVRDDSSLSTHGNNRYFSRPHSVIRNHSRPHIHEYTENDTDDNHDEYADDYADEYADDNAEEDDIAETDDYAEDHGSEEHTGADEHGG